MRLLDNIWARLSGWWSTCTAWCAVIGALLSVIAVCTALTQLTEVPRVTHALSISQTRCPLLHSGPDHHTPLQDQTDTLQHNNNTRLIQWLCVCVWCSVPLQSGPKCPGGQQSGSSSIHNHSNRSGASCCLRTQRQTVTRSVMRGRTSTHKQITYCLGVHVN
jgi:hypothetical protein